MSSEPAVEESLAQSTTDLKVDTDIANQMNGYRKSRSMSTGSAFVPENRALTPHHPALVLPELLEVFGPLIFPLFRAALLRKRILLLTEAPVEKACDFGMMPI